MDKADKPKLIRATVVIAIMRAQSSDQLIAAAGAVKAGGIGERRCPASGATCEAA